MLGAADQADDAAQDIFVKAYERLPSFKEESSFGTWLYRLASNHCLDLLRARSRRKTESLESLVSEPAETPGSSAGELAHHLLSLLSADHRLILSLRELQGLTYDEIAQVLGLSLDAVKAKLRRARIELQEKYDTFAPQKASKD